MIMADGNQQQGQSQDNTTREWTEMADKNPDDFDSPDAETPPNDVTREADRVRDRAYQLWEQSGRGEGRDVDHWLEAEREIGSGKSTGS